MQKRKFFTFKMFHMEHGDEVLADNFVNVGDKVVVFCSALNRMMKGVVVYVHPEKRYYRVEIETPGGKFYESFLYGSYGDKG